MKTMSAQAGYVIPDHDVLLGEKPEGNYDLQFKDLPDADKPREKLTAQGPGVLSVPELLAAILGVGSPKEDVLALARRIIKEYGDKSIAAETDPRKIAAALGIPLTKACQIVAVFELGRRFYANRAGKPIHIRNAQQAYEYLQAIGYSAKEQLRGLYLNSRYEIIHDEVISVGSLTANIVHPREVFRPAIEHGAVAVIIAHNHPSGNPEPTDADLTVTRQLIYAGAVLGIELLDHLIIADRTFIRIKEQINE